MKLLLARGADPKIDTVLHVTALQVAAGIGWVEGITYEWSPASTLEAVKMLLDLGLDPNVQSDTGVRHYTAPLTRGGRMSCRFWWITARGSIFAITATRTTGQRQLAVHTWLPVDYADGLVRVACNRRFRIPRPGFSSVS